MKRKALYICNLIGVFSLRSKEPFTGALVTNKKEKESHPLLRSVWLFSFPPVSPK